MDENEARQLYESLNDDLRNVEERAQYFMARQAALRKVLEGLEELHPDVVRKAAVSADNGRTESVQSRSPVVRGPDVLGRVMRSDPKTWFSSAEVLDRLANDGVKIGGETPEAMVRKWLRDAHDLRMVARRKRDGRTLEYRWLTPGEILETNDGGHERSS